MRSTKSAFPASDGWVPLEFKRFVKDEETGKVVPEYNKEPWGFPTLPARVAKDSPKIAAYEAGLTKASAFIVDQVRQIEQRAASGDPVAKEIITHTRWYKDTAELVRRDFGGQFHLMGDLLAALSPRTDVPTNTAYAIEAIRKFMAGEYAPQLRAFAEHLNQEGATPGNYKGEVVLKDNGTKYGFNSKAAMVAMLDLWRNIEPGAAPKARTFGGNLTGRSKRATIDSWAARGVRRALGTDTQRTHELAAKLTADHERQVIEQEAAA